MKPFGNGAWTGVIGPEIDLARDLSLEQWRVITGLPDAFYWDLRSRPARPSGGGYLEITEVDWDARKITVQYRKGVPP